MIKPLNPLLVFMVTPVKPTLTYWPAVPLRLSRTSWPDELTVSVNDDPVASSVPVIADDRVTVTLPVLRPESSRMVYGPLLGSPGGSTCVPPVPKPQQGVPASEVPSGLMIKPLNPLLVFMVTPVKPTLTYWPAVPLKLSRTSWPGELTVSVNDDPVASSVPVIADDRVTVTLPVLRPESSRMVYVPLVGSTGGSICVPPVPKPQQGVPASEVPSGLMIKPLNPLLVFMVTPVKPTLTYWPAVPLKLSRTSWPGELTVSVNDDPVASSVPVIAD